MTGIWATAILVKWVFNQIYTEWEWQEGIVYRPGGSKIISDETLSQSIVFFEVYLITCPVLGNSGQMEENSDVCYFDMLTFHIVLLASSVTSILPSFVIITQTGRPYTSLLVVSLIKPVKKSSAGPVGLPAANGTNTIL